MQNISLNVAAVRAGLDAMALRHGRDPRAVALLAVSKTQPPAAIRAAAAAGQRDFGENYLQEALEKIPALADLALTWHFIGPVQSNKTRQVAQNFHWVHSVDREKIARRLAEARDPAGAPLSVCLQVNISGEDSKSGAEPSAIPDLAAAVAALPGLRLRGLMALPAPTADFAAQRAACAAVRKLFDDLKRGGLDLDTLSLGTSSDMEAAVAEGATLVRIGTAIFGPRQGRGAGA